MTKYKTVRLWPKTYERVLKMQKDGRMPEQLTTDPARLDYMVGMVDGSAASNALDDICRLLDVPDWEYPGQVVRDVARAVGMSLDDMAAKLRNESDPTRKAGD